MTPPPAKRVKKKKAKTAKKATRKKALAKKAAARKSPAQKKASAKKKPAAKKARVASKKPAAKKKAASKKAAAQQVPAAAKPVPARPRPAGTRRLLSWNVNGLRAILTKGFAEFVAEQAPDVLCLQEIKAMPDQVELDFPGYEIHWNPAEKKGYSGTLVMSRLPILSVRRGLDEPEDEGRALTCEFDDFFLVNVYTPNAAENLKRLDFRMDWDRKFLRYVQNLEKRKPVIFCGDTNVAHKEIDLKNPKANRKNPGFTDEERAGFSKYIEAGFIDTFRQFNQEPGQYTWWSYRFNARAKNIGWRIDYFLISASLRERLVDAFILQAVVGSDHCPVGIDIK